ncbi:hypothetical protein EJ07DRAFT_184458 [Lizonia empirigonia]|nr:hypothetical protein EJ07DRAFT_184458 [Lizonia empirigonia]
MPGIEEMTEKRSQNWLLALPPEIRNKIYDILFGFEDPIAFLGHRERSRLKRNNVRVDKLPKDLKNYVALLRTCRQVYCEAGSILYGSNEFRLAHAHSVLHDRNLNYILHATARWLESIKHRIPLLRTVIVTVNETTRSDSVSSRRGDHDQIFHGCFDILPLVKLYWSDKSGNLQVRFQDSVGVIQMLGDRNEEQIYRPVNTDILHKVLEQVGRADIWDLKKSRSFLHSILLRRDGYYGYVCYRATGPRAGFRRQFNILNGGKELRLFHPQKPSKFLKLPKHLQRRIITESLRSEFAEYDVGSSRWLKHSTSLLEVCRKLRGNWTLPFTLSGKFLLSEYAQSQSDHFHRAGPFGDARWLLNLCKDYNKHLRKKPVYLSRIPFTKEIPNLSPPTIMLDLSSETATSLSAITISAARLYQLHHFPSSTPITFRLSRTTTRTATLTIPTEQSTTTLATIIRRTFLFLSDIYLARPPRTLAHYTTDIHINGHGTPVSATLHTHGRAAQRCKFANARALASAAEVASLVSARIAQLKNDLTTRQDRQIWARDFAMLLSEFGALSELQGRKLARATELP